MARRGLGSSVQAHRARADDRFEVAESFARSGEAAAKEGRCVKAFGSLKVAHEAFGEGKANADAGRHKSRGARGAAEEALHEAGVVFWDRCLGSKRRGK